LASGDPAMVTWTRELANRPATLSSADAPLGEVGDDDPPPQAENSVASVAPPAAWQAPAQNRRRVTAFVSDISVILVSRALMPDGRVGKFEAAFKRPAFVRIAVSCGNGPITDWGSEPVIS
jgi:hypothetical protein